MVDEGGGGQQEGRRVRSPSHTFRRRKGRKTVQVLCFFPALLSLGPPTQRTAPPSLLRGMSPCRSPARRHIFYTFPPLTLLKCVSLCVCRDPRDASVGLTSLFSSLTFLSHICHYLTQSQSLAYGVADMDGRTLLRYDGVE